MSKTTQEEPRNEEAEKKPLAETEDPQLTEILRFRVSKQELSQLNAMAKKDFIANVGWMVRKLIREEAERRGMIEVSR